MKEITSRENQWVRMAHSLKKKKGRQEQSRFLAEGFRLLSDAIQVGVMDGICFVTEKGMHHEGFDTFLSRGETLGWTFFHVTDSVYDKIKDTGNPQGMAAMLPLFPYTLQALDTLKADRPVLYLEDIQDPGNLGTMMRTAEIMQHAEAWGLKVITIKALQDYCRGQQWGCRPFERGQCRCVQ